MTHSSLFASDKRTASRNRAEKRFRAYGIIAISVGLAMLAVLIFTIIRSGSSAFQQSFVSFEVMISQEEVDNAEKALLKTGVYQKIITANFEKAVTNAGIVTELSPKDQGKILSKRVASQLREFVLSDNFKADEPIAFQFLANSSIDGYLKGRVSREGLENNKNVSVEQLNFSDKLVEAGLLKKSFNIEFITGSDASENSPEAAGFGSAILGSFAMMIVVVALSLPIGVAASIYLEEFAPKNRLTDIIEVNISNLAAVPSIVYGILGLALFLNYLGPISANDWIRNNSPFVGGLVLALMTLPRIVIPTRAALKAVPPSIRDAALGIGASKMQTVFHHVLPLAMPGILTGTIIGLAQALGESAPLLLIGLVGFIGGEIPANVDQFFGGPNTVMPAQIYQWASRADPAFYERAWGGIIILLVFLISMNAIAIVLRRRFERRW